MVKQFIHDLDTAELLLERLPPPILRRGPFVPDEPTEVRRRPSLVAPPTLVEPQEPDVWALLLQDPTVPIAAVTALLAFGLSVGSGTIGFLLGYLVGGPG
jgi:hypothetical protein